MREQQHGRGPTAGRGQDPAFLAAIRRRSSLFRLLVAAMLMVGGAVVVVLAALPSHPRAVTGTVTAVPSPNRITVAAPGVTRTLTVEVDPTTTYDVGASVVVTVQGTDPSTATVGAGQASFTNLWTGTCMLAAGVLVALPLVRAARSS